MREIENEVEQMENKKRADQAFVSNNEELSKSPLLDVAFGTMEGLAWVSAFSALIKWAVPDSAVCSSAARQQRFGAITDTIIVKSRLKRYARHGRVSQTQTFALLHTRDSWRRYRRSTAS